MSTPCNSLNVQLIKVTSLANYTALKDADILMIVENTAGSKYSRQSSLSQLKEYVVESGFSSYPAGAFYSAVDSYSLDTYYAGNSITFNHGLTTTPSLVKVVLKANVIDGQFAADDELDVNSCYNNNNRPFCSIKSNTSQIKIVTSAFTTITTYNTTYSPSTVATVNLTLSRWNFKVYAWK